jgi:hypothetical protein
MAEPIKPVAKMVYVCDEVIGDPLTGKVNLLNLWDAIRVPAGSSFPYSLGKLCVFAWWRDGFGKVRTRIDIVQASTEAIIRRSGDFVIDFPRRTMAVFARYKFERCVFPAPGYYYIELYCENEFVDDQVIQALPP